MAFQLLYADDSATMHRVVQITLAREAAQLLGVSSGRDAVLRARQARPDIAVLDINMPDMDGYAACQALKDDPSTGHIPVLLLASSQSPIDSQRAQDCGADGHLLKPFDTQSFVDKIKQTLSQAGAKAAAPVEVRPVEPVAQAPRPQVADVAPPAPWAPATSPAAKPVGLPAAPTAPIRPQPSAAGASAPFAGLRPQPTSTPAQTSASLAPPSTPAVAAQRPPQPATLPHAQPQAVGPQSVASATQPALRPALRPATAPLAGGNAWSVPSSAVATSPQTARPQPAAAARLPSAAFVPAQTLQTAPLPPPTATAPRLQAASAQTNHVQPGAILAPRPAAAAVAPVSAPALPRSPSVLSASPTPAPGGLDATELMAAAKEILERVAWEVVPPMAEAMIKEHIERLARR